MDEHATHLSTQASPSPEKGVGRIDAESNRGDEERVADDGHALGNLGIFPAKRHKNLPAAGRRWSEAWSSSTRGRDTGSIRQRAMRGLHGRERGLVSARTDAMEPSVTDIDIHSRNVRSFDKVTLGSTRFPYTASLCASMMRSQLTHPAILPPSPATGT